jgi:predicted 3-demethylubiquinone-9 3-methyltransferase (glyoxalase superfamily)
MPALDAYPLITPFLWFESHAEPAAQLYTSIFPNSRILETLRMPIDTPSGPAQKVLTIAFELDGLKFTALNGGPHASFTDAISFVIRCESQSEIDRYWSALTADGGKPGQCGWLKDPFGVSWQVIPANLPQYIRHPAAMQAMLQMTRLDIATLEAAAKP